MEKKSKNLLIGIAATLFLALSCSAGDGWVRVKGNKFVDPKGKELVFRGLCFSDPVKLVRDGQWNERYFAEAADWGANAVRFAVHPTNLDSLGWEETFQAMDQGVAWAKKHGMYVIMDWHSIGNLKEERYTSPMYVTTLEETFKFWRTVAQRYKDEPTVALYELYNEPTVTAPGVGDCTWTEWKEIQERIIDTVRTYNPHAVCLCAGFNWAYDLTPVATEPIDRPNVAYVSHPYPMKRSEPWEEQWEKDFGYVADTYPVICTEIGYCLEDEPGAHIPVISTDVYGEHITKYFEKKGISFTVWCFDPNWGPMLIRDWNFTPTTQGRFFKAYLQGKDPSEITPAPVNPNATAEAKELLSFLYSISGRYTLAGEHNFSSDLERYDAVVHEMTGKYPVVWGSDFSFSATGDDFARYQHAGPLNLTVPFEKPCIQTGRTVAEARQDIVDTAIRKAAEGRIITLMWHCCDPRVTDGNECGGDKVWTMENAYTQAEWDELCTDGTALHEAWEREMDTVIPYLRQLQEAHVPVLWRPYHEMNGAWFWWGNHPGENGFKRLWIMTYKYFTDKGLDNLIWVWDPNAPRVKENDDAFPYADFYPGNDYVDVLAADIYGWDYKQSHHDELVELGGGKPIAMGEIGQLPKDLAVFEEQPAWTWFMVWGYFINGHRGDEGHLDLVRSIYDSPRILTLDEISFEGGKHRVR